MTKLKFEKPIDGGELIVRLEAALKELTKQGSIENAGEKVTDGRLIGYRFNKVGDYSVKLGTLVQDMAGFYLTIEYKDTQPPKYFKIRLDPVARLEDIEIECFSGDYRLKDEGSFDFTQYYKRPLEEIMKVITIAVSDGKYGLGIETKG